MTMAQQCASLRSEVSSLKKANSDSDWQIRELEEQLQAREDESVAHEEWENEKVEWEAQMRVMEDQLQAIQTQASQFMDAFSRETALRTEIKSKLDTQEKFTTKLSKDLKRKSEELKEELSSRSKEKYVCLAAAVRGLFGHKQMEAMSGEAFGDVGKALKKVKDLVEEGEERFDRGGNAR